MAVRRCAPARASSGNPLVGRPSAGGGVEPSAVPRFAAWSADECERVLAVRTAGGTGGLRRFGGGARLRQRAYPPGIQRPRSAAGTRSTVRRLAGERYSLAPLEGSIARDFLRRGALESLRAGVTTIADILTADWFDAERLLIGGGTSGGETSEGVLPRLVPFCEALGLRPDQREGQLDRARAHLQKTSQKQGLLAGSGLSPHAPYSVHGELLADLVRMAVEASAPVAMHLAETLDELELLATGRGAFVEFLERLGVWHPPAFPSAKRPLDYLRVLAKTPRALVVHGNYLADDELRLLATHPQMTLVYCPRTHAYFGHARPIPGERFKSTGGGSSWEPTAGRRTPIWTCLRRPNSLRPGILKSIPPNFWQ